jgi:hypothetical protein
VSAADYAAVLQRFSGLRQSYTRSGHPAWYGPCPVCGDRSPTHLRIFMDDRGNLKAKCYGGKCQALGRRDWWAALLSVTGTTAGEWFPESLPRGRVRAKVKFAATYDYRDEKGRLLFQCVKFERPTTPDPRWRKCSYRRPAYAHDEPAKVRKDDKGQAWVWDGAAMDLDKLEVGELVPATGTLYRLPELLAADVNQPVLLPEGEPDVETLRALGFVSVTNPHGSGGLTYPMCIPLSGRRVVLFEDNDQAGRNRCESAVGMLLAVGCESVRVARWGFDRAENYDVGDYLHDCFADSPAESHKMAAWFAANKGNAAKAKGVIIEVCKQAYEYARLTPDESATRRKKPLQPLQTLHEAAAPMQAEIAARDAALESYNQAA